MISDLIAIADDATDAVSEIERAGTPGDVIRKMNDELVDLRARLAERDALLKEAVLSLREGIEAPGPLEHEFSVADRKLVERIDATLSGAQCSEVDPKCSEVLRTQGEPVAWQFYQDGKWWNGQETNNHLANTEEAGYPVRDLYPEPWASALPDVDSLAQIIRVVDGNHSLGAGALAERILEKCKELSQ